MERKAVCGLKCKMFAAARCKRNPAAERMEMRRLLIVDDEKDVLFFLKTFFMGKGYEVLTAEGGEDAVRLVREERPHVVLLDILMPGMDGLTALRKIKAIDPAVAVIMATAVGDANVAVQAMEMGASDYIVKPFDFNYLETSVLMKVLKMMG